jgi:hypothetical protein
LITTDSGGIGTRVSEWEPYEGAPPVRGSALVIVVFGVLGSLLVAAAVLASGPVRWLAVAALVLAAAWTLAQRRLVLAGAAPARPEDHARLVNLATGLAGDFRMPPPRLYVSSRPGPNAYVVPGAIVVTDDLLATYTRTELEAAVAHCFVRLRVGGLGWALAGAAFGLPGVGARVDRDVDARVAAVTRYPPALASAITRATPARGRTASLWFVADGPSHLTASERAAELLDL